MRKVLITLLCCTAALFAAYVGYRGYKVWKQNHMINLARGFVAKGDTRNALLSVQQALRANPVNLEATRLMADLMQSGNSSSALFWRSRVVQLSSASTEDRLALAEAALAARDFISATNALEGVSAAAKHTPAYQNIAGSVDAASGRFTEAATHFSEAARLDPTNPVPRLNLALVQLKGTNSQLATTARALLRQLSGESQVRPQALRELVLDALKNRKMDDALQLSSDLIKTTNSVFQDRLIRLQVLDDTRNREFRSTLAEYQREVLNDPVRISVLGTWMLPRIGATETSAWLRTLPLSSQTNHTVAMLQAECRVSLKDWRGLQSSLFQQNWVELDFLRHAFLARAFREEGLVDSAKTEWEQANKAVNSQKQGLVMLLRLAASWNWLSEYEDTLWTIVNRYPEDKWAVQSLTQALYKSGQTRPLLTLFSQLAKRSPGDLSLKNNLAMTAMLLNAEEVKPYDLAREIYEKASTNASYASTYAFALHLQKKDTEAMNVMERLSAKELETPSIAGYYGLILHGTGNKSKAKSYIGWATKSALLPEEKKMFDKALASL